MKRMLHKLRGSGGETLTETLAAVLVVSCASVLLATMILAASHMNGTAREQDEKLYAEISSAEAQSAADTDATVTATEDGGPAYRFDVSLYGEGLRSYRRKGAGA